MCIRVHMFMYAYNTVLYIYFPSFLPSFLSALQPWVSLGIVNSQSLYLSFIFSIHCLTFITFRSATTSSAHLKRGLPFLLPINSLPSIPGINIVLTFQVVIVNPISKLQRLLLILPRLIVRFRNKLFLRCGVVSPTRNPQPGGPGYPFSSGSSPLTCLAWVALPAAYATASIALGFI